MRTSSAYQTEQSKPANVIQINGPRGFQSRTRRGFPVCHSLAYQGDADTGQQKRFVRETPKNGINELLH